MAEYFIMTEYIVKTDRNGKSHIKVKFHAPIKRFKRVETLRYNGNFYNIYVNKLNNVHHFERTEVLSWKEVTKGKKKFRVPETIQAFPEYEILNKIRGNAYETAVQRIMTELEKVNI